MIKKVQAWQCKCGKLHLTEAGALDCEHGHGYACCVCGSKYKTPERAKQCESHPLPEYAFTVGEHVSAIDATIIALLAKGTKTRHLPLYRLDHEVEYTDIISEGRILWYQEYERTCSICRTKFDTPEEAAQCQSQGEPDFKRYIYHYDGDRDKNSRYLASRFVKRDPETGLHVPFYRAWIPEIGEYKVFTEKQVLQFDIR